ncbi:MAG: hypothetical protein EOP19_12665, partial [Hyphomicrobiales bacterium]
MATAVATIVAPAKLAGPPLGTAEVAAHLVPALLEGDILFAAVDEPTAMAITRSLAAAAPEAIVL